VAAITVTIETGASQEQAGAASKRLGVAREQLMSACNQLLDELVRAGNIGPGLLSCSCPTCVKGAGALSSECSCGCLWLHNTVE